MAASLTHDSGQTTNLILDLHPGGSERSAYHGQNNPNDIYQRKHLVERGSTFSIQSSLALVAHGTESPGGEPCSLIIVHHQFISEDPKRKFKNAILQFTFFIPTTDPRSPGGLTDKPRLDPGPAEREVEIIAIFPFNETVLSETSTEKVTKFGAAANYEDGLTKFGGGIAWERTATTKHIKRGSVQGLMRCTNPNTFVIKDIARWIVNQNPDDPGIPAFMATAMLVRRPSHDRIFAATVKITADVDSAKATLANKWDEIVGKVPKVDPVYFNPALPPKGTMPVPRGLKTNDIGDYWEALVKGEVSC